MTKFENETLLTLLTMKASELKLESKECTEENRKNLYNETSELIENIRSNLITIDCFK